MSNELITEDEVQRALDYLRDNAVNAGKAKGQAYQLKEGRKVLKARIMKRHAGLAHNAAEREAYADLEYEEYLKGVSVAIEEDEKHRWLMRAAEARLECWRSQSANYRAMKI